jgi:leader peptidase (prepilin peptidase) / N-methyltransferase
LSYLFWPMALEGKGLFEFVFWIVFLTAFMALVVYDLRWFLLPNKIVFPLIGLAIVQVIGAAIFEMDFKPLLLALSGALVVSGIFYALFRLSNGAWIGGGDVKLGIVLGLLAGGLVEGFLLLFLASVAGMLAALPLIVQGKANRKTQLPFGPFLIVGLIVVKLFGIDVIDWYTGLLYV